MNLLKNSGLLQLTGLSELRARRTDMPARPMSILRVAACHLVAGQARSRDALRPHAKVNLFTLRHSESG